MRFYSRAAIAAVTCLLAGVLSQGVALSASAAAHQTAAGRSASPAPGPMGAALLTAKATGNEVAVPSRTTATSTTVALPDGKFAMTTYVMPVRVKQHGAWVPVSAALRRNADGTWSPAATPSGLVLSGGGTGPFAVLTSPSGKRLSMTFGFRLPTPSVTGATVDYADVLPGVDLDVTATDQGGFDEVLVIKNAAAAADPALRQLRITTAADGLTVRTDAAGNMTASPAGGSPQFVAAPPRMWDSGTLTGVPQAAASRVTESSTATPSSGAHVAAIGLRAVPGALVLTLNQRMLTAPSTRFPVFADPVVNPASSGTGDYTETQQGCPTYTNWDSPQTNGEGAGFQNYPGTSCQGLYRSFYQLNTENLNSSMVVSSATLLTAETYGSDQDCSDTWPVTVKWTSPIHPDTDWNTQPSVVSSIAPMDPKSAWCGTQDVDFNVKSEMVSIAEGNDTTWTFGLYGDESDLPDSSCSPSSAYNCGFMRFADNPSVTTMFDITPSVPTDTTTTPSSVDDGSVTGPGCGSSNTIGWIGATDLGANNGSEVTLNATLASDVEGKQVHAEYTIWDNSIPNDPVGSNVVASPVSADVASGTAVDEPVGTTLQNGHAYGWRVAASDGTLTSQDAPDCHFNVDTTPPTVPAVTSSTFPPSGSNPTSPPLTGTTGTFSFASTDPAPAGCASACVSSGIAYYQYSFNTAIPTSGASRVAPGSTVPYTANLWDTNILYVNAVDNAGNVSQTAQYDFYVEWNPKTPVTAGDVDGDHIPDLLATNTAGDLLLYPGGAAPPVSPEVAGTPATSPDGSSWSTFQITHRGSMDQDGVDDLFAHKGQNLSLYQNNTTDPGVAPQFGNTADIDPIIKPSCAATASNPSNCAGYDGTDWSDTTQILAPGDVYSTGLPNLLTVEDGQLWLYKGQYSDHVITPVLLGSSSGSTNWSAMTIIAPGEVNGALTLWARDNSTGVIYSWPLTLDSNGVPELGTASAGVPVSATSGTVVGGVTLTSDAYPLAVSSGPLAGGTCGTSDQNACPGIYAEDTSGNLWYYEGQSATGGASPLSGTRMLVANINSAADQYRLTAG
jgi:hypothetical protein